MGERTPPCRTPRDTLKGSELWPFQITHRRCEKYTVERENEVLERADLWLAVYQAEWYGQRYQKPLTHQLDTHIHLSPHVDTEIQLL